MSTKKDRHGLLVTCDAESDGVTFEELRRHGVATLPGAWLDTGDAVQGSILLVESEFEFDRFSDSLEEFGSIFIRHLAPVQFEVELNGDETDIQALLSLVPELAQLLDLDKSFSVQTRILGSGKLPYRKVVLNETLSTELEKSFGTVMDCRTPEQVVSVLCTPTLAYVGVSATECNRSAWPGGKHRLKRDDNIVSRAEFKLEEAISVFSLDLPIAGRALDIGASPGGWTRLLAERGLHVDAVDPGDLDKRLKGNRLITHYRRRIQEYVPGSKRFDAIVNDMKMDARDSIDIMLRFAGLLTPEGLALITLKMPQSSGSTAAARKTLDMLDDDLKRLSEGYAILGARQLYHNRSEVTVAMTSLQS